MNFKQIMLIAMLAGLNACAGSMWPFERETEVPVDQVPEPVRAAAVQAVPGFRLTAASLEREDGTEIYELQGEADGAEVEIEVSAEGRVLEVDRDG